MLALCFETVTETCQPERIRKDCSSDSHIISKAVWLTDSNEEDFFLFLDNRVDALPCYVTMVDVLVVENRKDSQIRNDTFAHMVFSELYFHV